MYQYAVLALEIASERAREADRHRLARLVGRPSIARRALARILAASGRASMGAARRLDPLRAE